MWLHDQCIYLNRKLAKLLGNFLRLSSISVCGLVHQPYHTIVSTNMFYSIQDCQSFGTRQFFDVLGTYMTDRQRHTYDRPDGRGHTVSSERGAKSVLLHSNF